MIRGLLPSVFLLCLVGPLIACDKASGEGRLTASWNGADTGKVAARPAAVWCQDARRLEVTLVRDDLGIGLVLYPADTLAPGEFPAFDPGADTVTRPSAAAALRWFSEQAIEGYQSDSGLVVLEEAEGRFSGSFGFRLHSLDDAKILWLTGSLAGIAPGACRSDSLPASGPQG